MVFNDAHCFVGSHCSSGIPVSVGGSVDFHRVIRRLLPVSYPQINHHFKEYFHELHRLHFSRHPACL